VVVQCGDICELGRPTAASTAPPHKHPLQVPLEWRPACDPSSSDNCHLWSVRMLPGPQAAPDYFTPGDMQVCFMSGFHGLGMYHGDAVSTSAWLSARAWFFLPCCLFLGQQASNVIKNGGHSPEVQHVCECNTGHFQPCLPRSFPASRCFDNLCWDNRCCDCTPALTLLAGNLRPLPGLQGKPVCCHHAQAGLLMCRVLNGIRRKGLNP
jgi:hypothetical protein